MSDAPAVDFGQRMLALLDTGSFTASYKYAVLLTIMDAVLEGTDELGRPPAVLHGRDIGRRVLRLYWPQTRPFTERGPLRQSSQRGSIVEKITGFREDHRLGDHVTVEQAQSLHPDAFAALERHVVATVVRYPIPLLQKVGSGGRAIEQRCIYTYAWDGGVATGRVHDPAFDDAMHLVDGAGEHLIALAGLLRPVIQREWLAFVAKRNHADVDELRLQEFLFGGDRIGLRALVEPLRELQRGACFYCRAPGGSWDVDHFLPWSRWPDNTLDNLVLAHRRCNNDKRAALPGLGHLDRWWRRFRDASEDAEVMRQVADATGWPRRAQATRSAAGALYLRQPEETVLWVARPGIVERLDGDRLRALMRGPDFGLAAEDPGDFRT